MDGFIISFFFPKFRDFVTMRESAFVFMTKALFDRGLFFCGVQKNVVAEGGDSAKSVGTDVQKIIDAEIV